MPWFYTRIFVVRYQVVGGFMLTLYVSHKINSYVLLMTNYCLILVRDVSVNLWFHCESTKLLFQPSGNLDKRNCAITNSKRIFLTGFCLTLKEMTRNLYKMYELKFLMLGVLDTINKSKPTIVSDLVINDINRLSF